MRSLVIGLSIAATPVPAQTGFNGPMPCHVDMLEANIWMQCHAPCKAYLRYWPTDHADRVYRTTTLTAEPEEGNTLHFRLGDLEPGTEYSYVPFIDGAEAELDGPLRFETQQQWRYRSDPPDVTIALGSCAYINETAHDRPGTPFGGDYQIFDAIASKSPDMMIWAGDNVYLRDPDWGSWSGYLHRYTHARSLQEIQGLLRSTKHYATWDDHDFGPNNADGAFVNSALARDAFRLFWTEPGSRFREDRGIAWSFSHGDADFFLVDDRSFRVPPELNTMPHTLFGRSQLDRLVQQLSSSTARFKFVVVGGQVLNPTAVHENFANYTEERGELLERLDEENIHGVVFLTGDRHFTELSEMQLPGGNRLLEVTSSPLTAKAYPAEAAHPLRVEGTLVEKRNFVLIKLQGPAEAREIRFEAYDRVGDLLWSRTYGMDR
ncbi:MAG: alkaline phosphatase family protein [Flavobacteriales bacterium]|nr:alkaline phosphatase family protein [Flavobacteriales bacterium]